MGNRSDDKEMKKEIAGYWDKGGKDYDSYPGHGMKGDDEKAEWLKFLKQIVPEGTKNVLDVGCGTGFLTLLFAEMGYHVKGVDLSEGMQAEAIRKVKEGGFGSLVKFAIGDAENLEGEESDTYDLVINRHLLWTLPHPYEAVDEWLRVTKPGGCVIVIDGDWGLSRSQWEEQEEASEKKEEDDSDYSEELKEKLPLYNGEHRPWEFIDREGYEIDVVEVTGPDTLERRKYADDAWIGKTDYRREAYIIKKPETGK